MRCRRDTAVVAGFVLLAAAPAAAGKVEPIRAMACGAEGCQAIAPDMHLLSGAASVRLRSPTGPFVRLRVVAHGRGRTSVTRLLFLPRRGLLHRQGDPRWDWYGADPAGAVRADVAEVRPLPARLLARALAGRSVEPRRPAASLWSISSIW